MKSYMTYKKENGSVSIAIVGMLLFITIIFLASASIIQLSIANLGKNKAKYNIKKNLEERAEQVIDFLLKDPTPFADSPTDPVWNDIKQLETDDYLVLLEDASSFLGLNWIRKELFETISDSISILKDDNNFDDLQNFREESGLHIDLQTAFKDIIEETPLKDLFTSYNYFNINTSDEYPLCKLYEIRTGKKTSTEFQEKIQEARIRTSAKDKPDNRKHISKENLKEFLETDFDVLYPLINTEPVMNIHFCPEAIVKHVLSHYDIPESDNKALQLITNRKTQEFTLDELSEFIGADEESYMQLFVNQYLGVQTWFWRITVSGPEDKNQNRPELKWIIARVPEITEDATEIRFRLIEETYIP